MRPDKEFQLFGDRLLSPPLPNVLPFAEPMASGERFRRSHASSQQTSL